MSREYRYERKFVFEDIYLPSLFDRIKHLPLGSREIYQPRWINNIYFDTIELGTIHENLSGISDRKKYRLRWYGEMQGIYSVVFEIKIRKGGVGSKVTINLGSHDVSSLNREKISTLLKLVDRNKFESHNLGILFPILANRYRRSYFTNIDGRIRITVDSQPTSHIYGHFSSEAPTWDRKVVVEAKYAVNDEFIANQWLNFLPWRTIRNSKYVSGALSIIS